MRQIGLLESESSARTFSDFLYVQGIENQVEPEPGHGWLIWIKAEDHLDRSQEWLATYIQNPADPRFKNEAEVAAQLRAQVEKEKADYAREFVGGDWSRAMAEYGLGPLTAVLIVGCVVVFILAYSKPLGGVDLRRFLPLYISGDMDGLPEIRAGQVWRLVTPIFIHFGILHLIFNMLWLRDLGSMVEARQGSLRLAMLVLVIAAVSNFAQFVVNDPKWGGSGPIFGGMSGVVYGLIGYIWIRGKRDPASGLMLHPSTVTIATIWFFACLVGLVPHVANTAHAVGCIVGITWGYLSSLRPR